MSIIHGDLDNILKLSIYDIVTTGRLSNCYLIKHTVVVLKTLHT